MFRFEHPQWLYGLLIFVPLWLAVVVLIQRKRKRFARLGEVGLLLNLTPDYSVGKQYLKSSLLLLSGMLLVVALANPQMGTTIKKAERKGVDLMVALDISNSMNCEDIQPSRLMRSKQALIRLLDKLGSDRIGIVVFAGNAFLQLPLTSDYGAAKLFISEISTDDISIQGTSVGAAIDLCLQSFEDSDEERENLHNKAIIVISDGEDHEETAMEAARKAAKMGVAVHTIGMGLPQGGLIPIYNNGRIVDYKKDRDGNTVVTKLNEEELQQIAAEGRGNYVGANQTSAGVEKVFEHINQMDKTLLEQRNISDYESMYRWPLALALFFLLLDVVIFSKQHRRLNRQHLFGVKDRTKNAAPLTVWILIGFCLSGSLIAPVQAQTIPLTHQGNRLYEKEDFSGAEEFYRKGLLYDSTSSRLIYNLGNTQYKQGLYEQAAQQYSKVLERPYLSEQLSQKQRAHAAHNLGNAYVQTKAYDKAVEAYKQALRQQPNDADTKYNLAYAQKLLRQQQQQQQQNQKDQKDQKDQDKQDQQNQQQQNQQDKQDKKDKKDQQNQQNSSQQDDKNNQPQNEKPRESESDKRKKNDAEKILQALENQEKKTLDKVKKKEMPAKKKSTEKDW